jgi:hypothetical protein
VDDNPARRKHNTSSTADVSELRVLKEWFTRSVWQGCQTKNKPEEDSIMLDDYCHDLINELSQWWIEAILGGQVAEI